MATKDFKVRHGLTVVENATIEGNLTLGGNTVSRVLDSDEVVGIINNNTSGFDSDQVVAIIGENPGSQTISTTIYTFTSSANDSDFSGTDDNGRTLGYTAGKIHVYLNGILLTETVDYIASNGSTVSLINAPDSDDVLTVVKFLGTVQAGFDSDQVVAIINENVVSGSVDSDVAAVAALRRDLDSESIQISALRRDVDSDSTTINNLLHESDTVTTIYANVVGPTLFSAKNQSGETLFPGTVVYISGVSGNTPTVDKANASSSSTMPAFGIVSEESSNNSEVLITTFGTLKEINTEGFNVGDTIYVSADSDGAFTATKPTGETELIQNIGYVTRVHASSGSIKVGGSGRTNDIDNVTRARLDSDSTVIQNHSGRINVLESRADSDETQLQVLNTSINTLRNDLDSESGEISALRRDADSDSLVIQTLRGDVDTLQDVTHLDSESVARVTDTQFTIVNNGASAYSFTGDGFPSSSDNPTLYLQRGHTYHFNVNASGHPFEIRLSNGGSAYSTGITNNAAQVGRVVFTVPMDAPDKLVYQCTNHSSMVGDILVSKKGFDSDQIASMILENAGSGITDSDLKAVSDLRNDLDSETSRIEQLRRDLDSESAVIRTLRAEQDSDSTNSGGSGGGAAGFDSDQIVTIISENAASNSIVVTTFIYTSPANDSDFSGADDNGRTLSYAPQKIDVYLNGILLSDTVDYIATDGSTVTLVNAPDSDDILTIKRYFGTENAADNINVTVFTFTATGSLDSEFSGTDDNGSTLSYKVDKIHVYLNGILLTNTTDYTATNGTSITLSVAPDSDDVLTVVKYLGTVQAGFDSDQVIDIINETAQGLTDSDLKTLADLRNDLDSESAVIRQLRREQDSDSANSGSSGGAAGFDSDQVVAIISENAASNSIVVTRFDFTATGGLSSTFSGTDDNGRTLQYAVGKIDVYLNGILLKDTDDYTATDGTSVVLQTAPDSDDVLTVKKYFGTENTSQTLNITRFDYTATQGQLAFTGSDNNSNTLQYETGKVQVYLNGILLLQTEDYLDSDGATITLTSAADSDDQLSIIKYLGTVQSGFDSDQIVAIINENVVPGSVDSDVAAIAQLRRDADSDSLVIQKLRQDLDSDSANSGGGLAAIDSDYIIARQIVDAKHYNYSGTLATNTGSKRLYMHRDGVLGTFDMHVATAPVGAAINITVKKNGSSIGTGTITSGNTDNNLQTLSTTTFDSGDYLTVDITQIGTTTAGEDLYVVFRIVG